VITHDRGLVDVDDILTPFLSSRALLGLDAVTPDFDQQIDFI
jgi:hypothetical protein